MWRCWLILALLLGGGGVSSGRAQSGQLDPSLALGLRPDYAGDLQTWGSLPLYRFDLSLMADYEQARLAGSGSIHYTNLSGEALGEIVLRLYPNYRTFGGQATLSNLRVDGQTIAPSLDESLTIVGLILPSPLAPGDSTLIEFDYETLVFYGRERLYNLYSYLETELTLPSALPLLSVYEPGLGWWRGTDHVQGDAVYSSTGHFDVTLRAPDYLKLITSGVEVDRQANNDGTISYRYAAPLMRDFALMASGRYQELEADFLGTRVRAHYLPGGEEGAAKALAWTLDAMAAYTAAFGEYVYREFDVVQTLTTAGGIEYPGLVVMASDYWVSDDPWFERIMVHEVGHQWWYGMVGNNQPLYTWLDEALTDYSVLVYMRFVYGQAGYEELLARFRRIYGNYEAEKGIGLIGQPSAAYTGEAFLPIIYRKGAVFFHELSTLMGLPAFEGALQTYLRRHRYGISTPADLQSALETAAGQELDNWFLAWVGYSN
jgi:hypothetical protein